MKTKLIAYLLSFCLAAGFIPLQAFALQDTQLATQPVVEVYVDNTLGGTLSRTIEADRVLVTWEPFDGTEGYTAIAQNGCIYLNGTLIGKVQNIMAKQAGYFNTPSPRETITWGKWQDFSIRVDTGGMKTAAITVIIATVAPWLTVKIISGVASVIAGKYDYITVSGRMRLGSSTGYDSYYERYTNLYGNGTDALFDKDVFGSGKEQDW